MVFSFMRLMTLLDEFLQKANEFPGKRDVMEFYFELRKQEIAFSELNTAGFKYGLGHPNPTEDVLKRYHELRCV